MKRRRGYFKKQWKKRFEKAKQDLMWFFDIKPRETKKEPPTEKIALGALGEQAALDYFLAKGYVLLERNWRHSHSEIDLIMRDVNCVVFCEVRTQNLDKTNYLTPAESVTHDKLEALAKGASFYMAEHSKSETPAIRWISPCRFDLAEVYVKDGKAVKINHLKDIYIKNYKTHKKEKKGRRY